MVDGIGRHLDQLREAVAACALEHSRNPGEVGLVAVSKQQGPEKILLAARCGQVDFGENYTGEALKKMEQIASEPEAAFLRWHFIGRLQSNKTRAIAERFAWMHSLDRFQIAERLSHQRPQHLPPLNVCLQVDLDNEKNKAGIAQDDAEKLARAVDELPGLRLRGLMAIPAPQIGLANQRRSFARLRTLLQSLKQSGVDGLDTLSMGMTDDFRAAIAEGATWVRIGTAIFGQRPKVSPLY